MLIALLNGGPFMIVLLLLSILIVFISVKNLKEPYNTNGIVLLGFLSALIGIIETYSGVNAAVNAVPDIDNIAPQILANGIKTALITTFTGGFIVAFSTALWFYFVKKHGLI